MSMIEDFKHVMLSEPPPRAAAAHHSAGHGYQGVGSSAFENYKGILLCERPTHINATSSGSGRPFLPPGQTDGGNLGLGPSVEAQRMHSAARCVLNNKTTRTPAQQQHRRALKALAEQKAKARMDDFETQLREETRKLRFQENQSKARQVTIDSRTSVGNDDVYEDEESARTNGSVVDAPVAAPHEPFHAGGPARSIGSSSARTGDRESSDRASEKKEKKARKLGKKQKAKPKWAMTEDEIDDAEMAQANELLAFAEGLDVERYLDDFEVREALTIIKERVQELRDEEDDVSVADTELTDISIATSASATSAGRLSARKRKQERREEKERRRAERAAERDIPPGTPDPIRQLVERVLTQWPHLKEVHSRKSITKVIQEVINNVIQRKQSSGSVNHAVANALAAHVDAPVSLTLPAVNPPTIATHQATAAPGSLGSPDPPQRILTQLKKSKEYVQNLPYMYRCPSI